MNHLFSLLFHFYPLSRLKANLYVFVYFHVKNVSIRSVFMARRTSQQQMRTMGMQDNGIQTYDESISIAFLGLCLFYLFGRDKETERHPLHKVKGLTKQL